MPGAPPLLCGFAQLLADSAPAVAAECSSSLLRFESSARNAILRCCGWPVMRDPEAPEEAPAHILLPGQCPRRFPEPFLQALEEALTAYEGALQFERAALVALFHAGACESYRELERAVKAHARTHAHTHRETHTTHTHTPLAHAHRALHSECRGAAVCV